VEPIGIGAIEDRSTVLPLDDNEVGEFELVNKGYRLGSQQHLAFLAYCSQHLGKLDDCERVESEFRFVKNNQARQFRLKKQRRQADEAERSVGKRVGRKDGIRTRLLPA
jgi:hypothetical protein